MMPLVTVVMVVAEMDLQVQLILEFMPLVVAVVDQSLINLQEEVHRYRYFKVS